MVLDIDFFRGDKGHDPNKVRENQQKRFKDLKLVETVIDQGIFLEISLSQHC
jgi:seryl-tRNA synthetase